MCYRENFKQMIQKVGFGYTALYRVVVIEKKIRIHNIFSKNFTDFSKLANDIDDNLLQELVDNSEFEAIFESEYQEWLISTYQLICMPAGNASHAMGKRINSPDCKNKIIKENGFFTKRQVKCSHRIGVNLNVPYVFHFPRDLSS